MNWVLINQCKKKPAVPLDQVAILAVSQQSEGAQDLEVGLPGRRISWQIGSLIVTAAMRWRCFSLSSGSGCPLPEKSDHQSSKHVHVENWGQDSRLKFEKVEKVGIVSTGSWSCTLASGLLSRVSLLSPKQRLNEWQSDQKEIFQATCFRSQNDIKTTCKICPSSSKRHDFRHSKYPKNDHSCLNICTVWGYTLLIDQYRPPNTNQNWGLVQICQKIPANDYHGW